MGQLLETFLNAFFGFVGDPGVIILTLIVVFQCWVIYRKDNHIREMSQQNQELITHALGTTQNVTRITVLLENLVYGRHNHGSTDSNAQGGDH